MCTSRRTFLAACSAAMASVALTHPLPSNASEPRAGTRLGQLGYGDVALLEGPMRQQFDENHQFFLALNEDSLLKPYRERAGLPAPGEDMGGWYDNSGDFDPHGSFHGFVPGHSFGQYLSALARAYAVTGSQPTQAKVHRLVEGYAAAVSPKFYAGYHLPAYTFDKCNVGLIDAHEFAASDNALKALDATTDAVLPYLPPKALSRSEQYARPHKNEADCWDETYTLPENFFLAWRRGAGSRYRDLAVRFLEDDLYFDPLARGENVLPGEHAYSHVNALSSAMQAYLVLGSQKHLRAATNGFGFVRDTQSFATGGWGPDESFRKPGSGALGDSLSRTHAAFETPCGAYGHFKITRYLLCTTGDSRYGDSMERVLYNTVLGALPIQKDGRSFYYSDYNAHWGQKGYHRDLWPCCSGTLPQIVADYGISAYFHDATSAYVNLFVPSRATMQVSGARVQLEQTTEYPHRMNTTIRVGTDREARFAVAVRIPAWALADTRLLVNGKLAIASPEPGRFARIERDWRNGDRIEVEFARRVQLEAVDAQHPDLVAAVAGPLALFALAPTADKPTDKSTDKATDKAADKLRREQLLSAAQVAAGSTNWQAKTSAGTIELRPFTAIEKEQYRLYLHTTT